MTIDALRQNALSIIELDNNRNYLIREKNSVLNDIERYRKLNDKISLDSSIKKLENINLEFDKIKNYMIKVIINNQKIVEEEKNNLR